MTITGIGAVTGYGWGTEPLWNGLLSGKPAAKLSTGCGHDVCPSWLWAPRRDFPASINADPARIDQA
jgi:hypothetical protein